MSKELATIFKGVDLSIYANDLEENNALSEGLSSSAPMIKINGKEFALVVSGEIVQTFKDLKAVIVGAGGISKRYYNTAFTGKELKAPDCSSIDGIKPDDISEKPQCELCASCPHNAWGSAGKGKECRDYRRLVLCFIDETDDTYKLYRLDIPTMSLKSLKSYGELLSTHKLPMSAVLTKITMDPKETFAKLVFEPEAMLKPSLYKGLIAKAKEDSLVQMTLTMATYEKTVEVEEKEVVEEKPVKKASKKIAALEDVDFEKELADVAADLE
jgi:hypothetical protein